MLPDHFTFGNILLSGVGKEWIGKEELGTEIVRIATQIPFPLGTQIYEVSVCVSKYRYFLTYDGVTTY